MDHLKSTSNPGELLERETFESSEELRNGALVNDEWLHACIRPGTSRPLRATEIRSVWYLGW